MVGGQTIKAIETRYQGYRFRSRLEARWACFLDVVGIRWDYEPEGFDLDGLLYLPDFWLPELGVWLEIKPSRPDWDSCEKAQRLAIHSDRSVYILFGGIPFPAPTPQWGGSSYPVFHRVVEGHVERAGDEYLDGAGWLFERHRPDITVMPDGTNLLLDAHREQIGLMSGKSIRSWSIRQPGYGYQGRRGGGGDAGIEGHFFLPFQWWGCCDNCNRIGLSWAGTATCACRNPLTSGNPRHPILLKGYAAARLARFEHGEAGR